MKNTKRHIFIAAVAAFTLLALLHDESIYFAKGPTEAKDQRLLSTENINDPTITNISSILSTHEWPIDEMSNIPEGIYVSSSTSRHRLRTPQTNNGTNYGSVLLYVTSHMSRQHLMFLKYCWPNILARSALLREADVAVYLNPEEEERKEAMDVLKDTFAGQNLKVYLRSNGAVTASLDQKKASGANMAMYEAVTSKFFFGYDWVVRLNPDVIIRDDSFLIKSMTDPSIDALLISCKRWSGKAHTDFFVINPDVLHVNAFPLTGHQDAEVAFTHSIRESVLDKGSHRWIPHTSPKSTNCRAGDGRDFFESPIVHKHVLHPDICSVPSDVNVSAVFTAPWPSTWSAV